MKTFKEYLQEVTPQAGQPGAQAGTYAAQNKPNVANTGGMNPGERKNAPAVQNAPVTGVKPAGNASPAAQGTQGTQAPADMEEPAPVANIKSGQNIAQSPIKDFKATVTPGGDEVEFKSPDGKKTFTVALDNFIEEEIDNLKKLSGISNEN